jgi:MoaA/NifB/PqqE/SkfB family radical SAM enzyme
MPALKNILNKIKRHHTLKRLMNLLLVKLQLYLRATKLSGRPYFLVVESTNLCNLSCPLCPTGQGLKSRPKGKMSFNDFKKIIDELGAYLYSLRMENWGEPLLNEEIPMMIAYAKSKGIFTSFNTNLCLLDESIAKGLISSGLDHIKISLDGTNEQSYLKYRMGGDFRKVI